MVSMRRQHLRTLLLTASLVCLFSVGSAGAESRTVLDFMKGSILEIERNSPQSHNIELLGTLPWITLFQNRRDGRRSSITLLRLPFITVFANDRRGDEADVRIVEVPFLGSLYRHRAGRDRYRTEILFFLHIEGQRLQPSVFSRRYSSPPTR